MHLNWFVSCQMGFNFRLMLSHRLPNDVTIDQQWDQQRIGNGDKHKPLDIMNHPCKAEATIWLVEEVHRRAST
ncbi:hypothetical protein Peur_055562 [Populus x canadensis]